MWEILEAQARYYADMNGVGLNIFNQLFLMPTAVGFGIVFFLTLCISDVGILGVLWALWVSLSALCFSFYLLAWMYTFDEGSDSMQVIANAIQEGAEGYFAMQYGIIQKVTLVIAGLLFLLYFVGR